jgi:DNA helicase-2/ATP-dependent DNA helicase PcrA
MTQRYTLHKQTQPPASPSKIRYAQELNAEQLRVVQSKPGPTLVLAGPGSGKTRTLTYRVAYLLEQGIPPENILLVTFTVKAAREMMGRVERILHYRPEGLWGGTFHHIGNIIVRRHADRLGRTPQLGILDEEDAKDLITACIDDLKTPVTQTRLPQPGVLETILSLAVNTLQPVETVVARQFPQFSDQVGWIEKINTAYQERKRKGNLMDYDDLLSGWLSLMKNHDDIRRLYAEQFHFVLVDEYQDTNRLQFELVRLLGSVHQNVLAVGDDAQAIYSFRGADLSNLLNFPEVYPKAVIHRLETNYRSTPEIVELANASISLNRNQFKKELKSLQEPGPLPALVPLTNQKQQAGFIAQRILELRSEGVPMREMAILFRARFQSAELELELAKRNIPYLVRGGVRFFEQAHIKDMMAHLRVTANPQDEMAWERILRLQDGIGAAYARKIREWLLTQPNPIQAACEGGQDSLKGLSGRAKTGWLKLCKTMRELTRNPEHAQPAELLSVVLRHGYTGYLETHFDDLRERKEDLDQLINLASHYDSVPRFIEDLTLREPFKGETIHGWEEPDEFVVLSTIHQAKGLEWQSVFLIALSEGQFPHPKSYDDLVALEEERRLFYVAITRAKKDLYLTYPLTRYSYERGEVFMRPSQFVQELPEELFELWRIEEQFREQDPVDFP